MASLYFTNSLSVAAVEFGHSGGGSADAAVHVATIVVNYLNVVLVKVGHGVGGL